MNIRIASKAFALAALIAAGSALPGFSATTGTLSLSGTVAPVTSISVVADANASSLPVGSAVTNLKIATVVELTNNKAGYTVVLSSANGGLLKQAGGPDSLAYALRYDGQAVSFAGGSALVSDVASRTGGAGVAKELDISFASAFLNADSYSDTLTFTISAK